jgi:hypothetical protein
MDKYQFISRYEPFNFNLQVVGLFIRILTRAEVNWQEGKSFLLIFYVLFDLSSGVADGLVL